MSKLETLIQFAKLAGGVIVIFLLWKIWQTLQ